MNVRRIVDVLRRSTLRWGVGRHPLRRPIDRSQNAVAILLVVIALVALPFAFSLGHAVYRHQLATAVTQTAQRREVSAVLLHDAEPASDGHGSGPVTLTPARLRLPDGRTEIADIEARPGTVAGSSVPTWIDDAGHPTSPPLRAWQAAWQGAFVGISIMFAVAVTLGVAFNVLRWRLDQRRSSEWDAGWARFGPEWSHPR